MPPIFTDPVSCGLKGSDTSYCCNSPVPQQETYRYRSSSERLISVTNGGTALKPFRSGGSLSGSAGSAGISITFRTAHLLFLPPSSRCHIQMEDEKSFRETTTPTNPKVFIGSWEGRSSSTICCSAPRSISCKWWRLSKFQMCSLRPYFPPSSN